MAVSLGHEVIGEVPTNGRLFELKKDSPYGELISIAIRKFSHPLLELGSTGPRLHSKSALLINLYAEGEQGEIPIGHNDWLIDDEAGNNNLNLHDLAVPSNMREAQSKERWQDGWGMLPFCVDARYWRAGLGTLLIATSLLLLEQEGCEMVYVHGVTEPGRRAWKRFGIDWKQQHTPVPIKQLVGHPLVEKTVAEYL